MDLGPNVTRKSQEVAQHHLPVATVTGLDALHAAHGVTVHLHRTVAVRSQSLDTKNKF